jgi:hypothetical protein
MENRENEPQAHIDDEDEEVAEREIALEPLAATRLSPYAVVSFTLGVLALWMTSQIFPVLAFPGPMELWVWLQTLSFVVLTGVAAVGAAFDYHAGLLKTPPAWMQRAGLEWLWRLGLEPRRLWRRYVVLNPAYLVRLLGQWLRLWRPTPKAADLEPAPLVPV